MTRGVQYSHISKGLKKTAETAVVATAVKITETVVEVAESAPEESHHSITTVMEGLIGKNIAKEEGKDESDSDGESIPVWTGGRPRGKLEPNISRGETEKEKKKREAAEKKKKEEDEKKKKAAKAGSSKT